MADTLTIKINGNIKDYQESLKTIKGETKNLEDSLSSIAKTSAVAFTGLTAAVTGTVLAYREQEQAEIRTRQTIEATGKAAGVSAEEVFKMASALQNVTTFGDEAIIGGQNLLLTFKNIGKDVFPEVTETMLNMSQAMGQDLKSSAIQLGKALNDPTVGLTALSRVGITFTEQQKDQIKAMQESGDIAGAQKIILKELESQFGGTARAAAGGTSVFIQLKNIVGDLAEDIGRELAPMLIKAATGLKTFFLEVKENKELVQMVAKVLAVGTALTGIITVAAASAAAFLKLRAIFLATIPVVQGMSFSIKGLIGATGIGLLIVVLTDLALNWDRRFKQMQSIFQTFSSNITDIGGGLATFLKGVFTFDVDAIKEGFQQVKDTMITSFDELSNDPAFSDPENDPINKIFPPPEKVEEKSAESTEAILEAKQAEFDALLEQTMTNDQILTTAEVKAIEKRQIEKRKKDETDKILELQRQGKHDKALEDLEKLKTKRQLEEAKKRQQHEKDIMAVSIQATQNFLALGADLAKDGSKKQQALLSVNALISTFTAANQALASPPGPPFTIPLVASVVAMGLANVAKINGANFQDGGIFTGGIPGVDSIPARVQQNEIIAPTQNFEEVIGSVRAKREAEDLTGGEGGGLGGAVQINVSYDSPEASQIVTVRQVEDTSLGISQDSFKEAG